MSQEADREANGPQWDAGDPTPDTVDRIVRARRRGLIGVGGLAIGETLIGLAQPWPLKLALDHAIGGKSLPGPLARFDSMGPTERTIAVVIATMGLVAVAAGASFLTRTRTAALTERLASSTRDALAGAILRFDATTAERFGTGDLTSRLGADVDRVQGAAVDLATLVVPDTLLLVGIAAVLFAVDSLLCVLAALVLPGLWLITVRRRAAVRVAEQERRSAHSRQTSAAIEMIRHAQIIQLFGQQGPIRRRFGARCNDSADRAIDVTSTEARFRPMTELVTAGVGGLCLAVGVSKVDSGAMSTGTLLVVMAYVNRLFDPVRSLSAFASSMAKTAASRARLDEVLGSATPEAPPIPTAAPREPATIVIDQLRHSYDDAGEALAGISVTIPAGYYTVVVGGSGAGKTTLLRLLTRSLTATSGTIRLGGHAIDEFDLAQYRAAIAYVPQDAGLLSGSVADNIAFGSPTSCRATIGRAAWAGGADRFIAGLPQGYDTEVGEDGGRLSGGQRRRVALARAIIRDAPLILLDEPTSGLDAHSAAAIRSSLLRLKGNRTIVAISHELPLALDADQVVVLDAGRITEVGPPEALLGSDGPFSRLWQASQSRTNPQQHTYLQGDSHVEDERLLESVGRLRRRLAQDAQVPQVQQVPQVPQDQQVALLRPVTEQRGNHLRVVPPLARRSS